MPPPQTNQEVIIDLTKAQDIADEVADMQPGDEVVLHGTIKSLDEQTLVVTVQELSVPKAVSDGDGADTETPAEDTAEPGPSGMGDMMGEQAAT